MRFNLTSQKSLTGSTRYFGATRLSFFLTGEYTTMILTLAAVVAIKTCLRFDLNDAISAGHCDNCDGKLVSIF